MKQQKTLTGLVHNWQSTIGNWKFLLLALFVFTNTSAFAFTLDTTDYFSVKTLRYEDHTYVPNIKTVQLSPDPNALAPAIISLNSEDKLYLSFDDLDGDYKVYSYTLIHCNAKWEPSNILVSEYLDGFAENPITDYRFSRITLQKYTHYSVSFPDENVKLLKSGNYLLKVYTDNDADKFVFTKRFMVFENKVSVEASVHPATNVSDRNFKQEVDFTIDYNSSEISNAYSELFPVILQNYRWDNAVVGLQPQFLKDQQLVYDYDNENVFRGGSEFRWFDTRSLRYQSERIQHIEKDSNNLYDVTLLPDEKRTYKRYMATNDINGKFLIKTTDGGSSDVDADYCWVHFFLPWDLPTSEGNLYVFGALSDWQCRPDCRLKYNYTLKGYEADLYLKQGYYNYEYVILRDNDKSADDFFVEGMHQETENDYTILVYYRRPGSWADELVCVKRLNSKIQ